MLCRPELVLGDEFALRRTHHFQQVYFFFNGILVFTSLNITRFMLKFLDHVLNKPVKCVFSGRFLKIKSGIGRCAQQSAFSKHFVPEVFRFRVFL